MKSDTQTLLLRKLGVVLLIVWTMFLFSSCKSKEERSQEAAQKYYQKALELQKEGKIEEAVIQLKNAIQQDQNFAHAYYQLGLALLEQEDFSQGYGSLIRAVELYKQVVDEVQDVAERQMMLDARTRVAELYFNQGLRDRDLSKAEAELNDILEIAPKHTKAYILRGQMYLAQANLAQQDGDEDEVKKMIAYSLAAIHKSLELKTKDAEARLVLGRLYLFQEQIEDAQQEFNQVLALDPDNVQAYTALASIAFRAKDIDKAAELYQEAEKLSPDSPQVLAGMGEVYLAQNDYDKAIELADKLLSALPDTEDQILPEELSARFILGRAYLLQATQKETEDPEAAKVLYQKAKEELEPVVANARNLVSALKEFGFDLEGLSFELFLKEEQIIRMGVPPIRIEIVTNISGVHFEECYRARVVDELDGVEVNL